MTDFTRTSPLLTPEIIRSLPRDAVICIPRANRPPERWRVNGQLKTYARTPERFELPLKHGFYGYGRISNTNLDTLNELHAYIETP